MSDKLTDAEIAEGLALAEKATPGPWKAYPNPARADGLFVAQDLPITPYPGVTGLDGQPLYPATPGGWGIGVQIEPATARFIASARTLLPAALRELAEARTPCRWTLDAQGWFYSKACGYGEQRINGVHPPWFCQHCGHPVKEDKP